MVPVVRPVIDVPSPSVYHTASFALKPWSASNMTSPFSEVMKESTTPALVTFAFIRSPAEHASHARVYGFTPGLVASHVFDAHVPVPSMASSPAAIYFPAAHASHPPPAGLK